MGYKRRANLSCVWSGRHARFWVWERGGWCKITLRPGQALELKEEKEFPNGYAYSSTFWRHAGSHVIQEFSSVAKSPNTAFQKHRCVRVCPLAALRTPVLVADVPSYVNGLPAWGSREQWEACVAG